MQRGGSASYFQDFKKPKGKSYIYLNEVPRLNKTLSLFALGWSLPTQCGIVSDQSTNRQLHVFDEQNSKKQSIIQ